MLHFRENWPYTKDKVINQPFLWARGCGGRRICVCVCVGGGGGGVQGGPALVPMLKNLHRGPKGGPDHFALCLRCRQGYAFLALWIGLGLQLTEKQCRPRKCRTKVC